MSKFQTHIQKAKETIVDRYPENELKKLFAGSRSQDSIDLLRDAVQTLILNGIPTCTIAEALKKKQGTIQYHARWLESQGKIERANVRGHWEQAGVAK
jgi:DNA-binding transcriptional ArsR family regulator